MKVSRDKYLPLLTETATHDQISSQLQKNHLDLIKSIRLISQDKFSLLITGSDGRGEKMESTSPIETILVIKEEDCDLIAKITALVKANPSFLGNVDIKILKDAQEKLIGYNREKDLEKPKQFQSFPTRALDAAFLIGNQSIYCKYKHKFFRELQSQDKSNVSLLRNFRSSALKISVKLLRDNLAGKGCDFDLVQGIFYFDNERRKGPKYSMLRTMQYSLADYIFKLVSNNLISESQFKEIPRGVIGRLGWLYNNRFLKINAEEFEKLKKAYAISLIWSTEGQEKHKMLGSSVTELAVSPKQMKNTGSRILSFAQSLAQYNLKKLPNVK